ncbi:dethiobiotin synthase [delta proteobacterium NaphS2]|nr:dethiobiotin synthase [delta proteobacterium NaphS2]
MTLSFPQSVFVTGTDTGIGKTLTASVLTAGLTAEYWKPIQCGLDGGTDRSWVFQKTALPENHFHPETYLLKHPLSPHAAARLEDVRIDLERINAPHPSGGRRLIVEGAGGLLVPLNERHTMIDLIKKLGFSVILTARSGLGTINHTLLSLRELERNRIEVLGVVLNGPPNPSNREAIEQFGRVRVLAEIGPLSKIDFPTLNKIFNEQFFKRWRDG